MQYNSFSEKRIQKRMQILEKRTTHRKKQNMIKEISGSMS